MQCVHASFFELSNPAHVNAVDGDGVQIVKFFPALFVRDDQVRFFKNAQMFRHRLTAHFMPFAQLAKGESVFDAQDIQQFPAAGIGQCLENQIILSAHNFIMQPNGCIKQEFLHLT